MNVLRSLRVATCVCPILVALVPAEAGAVKALLSRWNQSQVHVWDSANPGATQLLHTAQCNDADINFPEGSTHGWLAEHFADYFARFVVGANMGLDAQYILGQGGRTHYAYPKHVTVHNGEVVVMSRNDGTLWRYNTTGGQLGSVKTAQNIGQGMASDGTDLYVSLWNGQASTFVRYDPAFVVKQTYTNPTGLGNFNNVVDMVYDAATGRFFGIATTGEGGTGTNSTTVVEFTMGGMVAKTYTLPFQVDGIGAYIDKVCGNGKVEPGEECDDGNMASEDMCTAACKLAKCGDGFVQANVEECDDGNAVNEDACTAACELAACGDGFLQMGEACDDGNDVDEDACTSACLAAACGDGFLQMGEGCDDGNDVDDDACSNMCVAAACGDGVVQMGEACDDGNDVDDDACSNMCLSASCGDGVVQQGEACDDGNDVDDDACSNACVAATCGDGVLQQGEECDDPADPLCVDCTIVAGTTGTTGETTTTTTDATTTTTTDATTGEPTTSGTGGTGGGTGDATTGDATTGDATGGASGSTGDDSATGGSDSSGASTDDGCGCTSNGGGGGLLALLALVGLRRRRRG